MATNQEAKILSEKFLHLRYLLTLAEQYKSNVYSRSQMLLAVTGAQFALIIGFVNWANFFENYSILPYWFLIIVILTIVIQLMSAIFIIKSIMPHKSIKSVQSIIKRNTIYTSTEDTTWLLSSFNHVAKKEKKDFIDIMNNITIEELYNDLLVNYYNLCYVTNERYQNLRIAMIISLWGFISLSLVTVLILFLL